MAARCRRDSSHRAWRAVVSFSRICWEAWAYRPRIPGTWCPSRCSAREPVEAAADLPAPAERGLLRLEARLAGLPAGNLYFTRHGLGLLPRFSAYAMSLLGDRPLVRGPGRRPAWPVATARCRGHGSLAAGLPKQGMWIQNVTLTMGLVDTVSIPTLLKMVERPHPRPRRRALTRSPSPRRTRRTTCSPTPPRTPPSRW